MTKKEGGSSAAATEDLHAMIGRDTDSEAGSSSSKMNPARKVSSQAVEGQDLTRYVEDDVEQDPESDLEPYEAPDEPGVMPENEDYGPHQDPDFEEEEEQEDEDEDDGEEVKEKKKKVSKR